MTHYIFSFSYVEKKKIKDLKNSFLISNLNEHLDFHFLNKKNFNFFFSDKHLKLKNILSGKYFIFSSKKNNFSFKEMLEMFEQIKKFLTSFEEDIFLFTIIYQDAYIFNDFLIKSFNYKFKNLFDLTTLNKKLLVLNLLKREIISYNLNCARINNLNLIKKNMYLSYCY